MSSVLVAAIPASAGVVRRQLTADLLIRGLRTELIEDAALIVTELVANAVRHGAPLPGGGVLVTWTVRSGVLRLQVSEGGPGPAAQMTGIASTAQRLANKEAESGRGLAIIGALATSWGIRTVGRTTVWAELAA